MKKTTFFLKLFALLALSFSVHLVVSGQTLTVRQIMAEPSIAGQRVEGERLSPDGKKVIYLWNAEGKMPRDLYLVPTDGSSPPVKILSPRDLPIPTPAPSPENKLNYGLEIRDQFVRDRENQLGSVEWSPDSKKLVFSHSGDVYVITIGEAKPKRFTKTQSPEFGARFLSNERILYMQGGNVYVLNTADATVVQLTKEANPQQNIGVGAVTPSKDGKMLAYVVTDSSKQRGLIVPNYLPEFAVANTFRRGWTEQKVLVVPTDGSRDSAFEIKLPRSEGVSSFRRMVWAADNRSLIVDRLDKDTKRRQLFYVYNVGSKDERVILITEETDEKWQAPLSTIFEPNPKNPAQLFFGSERDGYNHLYLATLEADTRGAASVSDPNARVAEGLSGYTSNVRIEQLTKGNWQVEWAKWINGARLIYMSTENGYLTRTFSQFEVSSRQKVEFFGDSGNPRMITGPQLSENDEPFLIFEVSRWNEPGELMRVKAHCPVGQLSTGGCPQIRIPDFVTQTTPKDFGNRRWTEPKFIEINSKDGKKIPAKIYLPPGHDPKKKYPMAIFVHGAGYLQNVINGWNNYYREFMFNDMLAKKGYVVLDIDFRGSAGYGRDWRTDVYDFLGGKDFDDHIDSIDHMVANYGVNQSKIGVYGGSYGGFMAGMLAMRAPERIAAAAALRPVFDWKNYYAANPFYTAQRLGFPEKNPEAYKRSSPISYADKLERPLLILHGMADDNVHVQDSVQLIEKLIRLNKTQYFDVMFYPSENHGFIRPESWADEYERILLLFEKHLK